MALCLSTLRSEFLMMILAIPWKKGHGSTSCLERKMLIAALDALWGPSWQSKTLVYTCSSAPVWSCDIHAFRLWSLASICAMCWTHHIKEKPYLRPIPLNIPGVSKLASRKTLCRTFFYVSNVPSGSPRSRESFKVSAAIYGLKTSLLLMWIVR